MMSVVVPGDEYIYIYSKCFLYTKLLKVDNRRVLGCYSEYAETIVLAVDHYHHLPPVPITTRCNLQVLRYCGRYSDLASRMYSGGLYRHRLRYDDATVTAGYHGRDPQTYWITSNICRVPLPGVQPRHSRHETSQAWGNFRSFCGHQSVGGGGGEWIRLVF